jgi:hypothetical protein
MLSQQLLLALLLFPIAVFGQDTVSVKGRIVSQHGEAIEYVQVCMPAKQIGTTSTMDGCWKI